MPKLLKWLLRDERPDWLKNRTPEVSTVDRAANLQPFAVFKSLEGGRNMSIEKILKGILESKLENEEAVLATLKNQGVADETSEGLLAAAKALKAVKDLPKNAVEIISKAAGLSTPEPPKTETPTPDPVEKALADMPEPVRKAFEETRAKAEAAERQVAELNEKALVEQYTKAAGDLKHLPGVAPAEFGLVLKAIAVKVPDAYKGLLPVLTAADKAISDGKLFEVKGSDSPEPGSASAKIDAVVKDLRAKDPNLTPEQAYTKALGLHPDLVEQIRKEA